MSSPADRVADWIRLNGGRLVPVARAFAEDADEAEDIVQEAWLVALRRAHELRPDSDPGGWLYRVVINVGRTRARTRARRRRLLRLWRPAEEPVVSNPPTTIEGERHRQQLWREIADLPALQREVVMRRILGEESARETAEAIGRSEGTVKTSLFRALSRLRGRLERDAEEVDSVRESDDDGHSRGDG